MKVFTEFEHNPLSFIDPHSIIYCHKYKDLPGCFAKIEKGLAAGFYTAGFVSYEAGYFFEEELRPKKEYAFPLLCFGLYKKPLKQNIFPRNKRSATPNFVKNITLNNSFAEYGNNINLIKKNIACGNVYQITYCIKIKFDCALPGKELYARLYAEQPIPYGAYINTGQYEIISLSPERFIKKHGAKIVTEPMKGTWPRGKNIFADYHAKRFLYRDVKNRAENLMITDLLRNDLGRIGRNIRVPKLFTVTPYKTLFQMTSTITADIQKNISIGDLFAALFPSGSVTGAPKLRAMQIIKNIEKEERKIYTGAIGYITPERNMYFNIPIRTILLQDGKGEMGIGGGIVWDSTVAGEWEEGLLKASFLTKYCTEKNASQ